MQPNQQPSPPSTTPSSNGGYVSPTGANVPDYLNMEPVADLTVIQKKNKKKRFIVVLFVVLIIAATVLGIVMYWLQQQNNPETKLYRALDKQLQVKHINRSYSVTNTIYGTTASYEVETDISNPSSPKSRMAYTEQGVIKRSSTSSRESDRYKTSQEQIIFDNTNLYYKYTDSTTSNAMPPGTIKDQWYGFNLHENNSSQGDTEYNLNRIDDLQRLNSTQGLILSGNFSDTQRRQLMDDIRMNNTYPIINSSTDSIDNLPSTRYDIKIDRDKINDLNGRVAKLLNLNYPLKISSKQPGNESLQLWVDDSTDQIVKMLYMVKKGDGTVSYEKDVTISYPSRIIIEKPVGIEEAGVLR